MAERSNIHRFGIHRLTRYYQDATIREKEAILGVVLIIPSLLLIGAIILYPLFYNIYLSFHEVPLTPGENPIWQGFAHYEWLFSNPRFWNSLMTTVIFTAGSTVLATAGGLGMSMLLMKSFRGDRFMRGLLLLPYVTPIIAVAFAWRWMFNTIYGIIPHFLRTLGFTEIAGMSLLAEPETALWIAIIFDGWRYFPFAFLLIYARAQAIPSDMYEAARIDGAGRLARFKDITLPELKFVLATVFLLRWIWNFNKFADVWLLTRRVDVLAIFTYQTAFNNLLQGRAAAISIVLFLFLMSFVLLYVSTVMEW